VKNKRRIEEIKELIDNKRSGGCCLLFGRCLLSSCVALG